VVLEEVLLVLQGISNEFLVLNPEGQRTIGVLSKVDLMDEGTDVVDILAGRIIPLRISTTSVPSSIRSTLLNTPMVRWPSGSTSRASFKLVNRGQRDIENKKLIAYALENEKNFFENHKAYRNIIRI
jgi:hypothetical protein